MISSLIGFASIKRKKGIKILVRSNKCGVRYSPSRSPACLDIGLTTLWINPLDKWPTGTVGIDDFVLLVSHVSPLSGLQLLEMFSHSVGPFLYLCLLVLEAMVATRPCFWLSFAILYQLGWHNSSIIPPTGSRIYRYSPNTPVFIPWPVSAS